MARTAELLFLLCLPACGTLPSAGPTAASLADSNEVTIVEVTPQQARARADEEGRARAADIQAAIVKLAATRGPSHFCFSAGDTFHLTVFTISPWLSGTAAGQGVASVPGPVDFGHYLVAEDGTVVLPYIGTLAIEGLDLSQAEAAIGSRYEKLGLMQSPAAGIEVTSAPRSNILVTGAVGAPAAIPWTPAGVSLAEALTHTLGNGTQFVDSDHLNGDEHWATQVSVLRGDAGPVKLPLQAALENRLPLQPADRIVVSKAPAVRIIVLGGGVSRDGVYEFARTPTLASVLAQASGLDLNVANDRAVFVLEQGSGGEKPTLFDFSWDHPAGLIASQDFPLRDGNLVYVDNAPIIPVQKALNLLFEAAVPATLAK